MCLNDSNMTTAVNVRVNCLYVLALCHTGDLSSVYFACHCYNSWDRPVSPWSLYGYAEEKGWMCCNDVLTLFFLDLPQEDFQLILQQQVKSQQQAEQNQKKPSRMGILRRTNRAPMQRPTTFPVAGAATPANSSNQSPTSKSAASAALAPKTPPTIGRSSNWRDKLRMGKSSRQGDQDLARGREEDDGFQVVSLDWSSDDFEWLQTLVLLQNFDV